MPGILDIINVKPLHTFIHYVPCTGDTLNKLFNSQENFV